MLDTSAHFKVLQDRVPHVAKVVERLWGSAALNNYIYNLLLDTRNNTRQGFPKEVASALLAIVGANKQEHPATNNVHENVFDGHGSIWGRDDKVL